ncbi:MAG: hypothetical protein ABEI74_01730 [Candidatus Pacearchaeota archaeon]
MENAQMPYKTVSKDDPENKLVVVQDIYGQEVVGVVAWEEEALNVQVLEDQGDKVFAVLPKGFNRDTAWIDSRIVDYLKGNR